MSRPLTRLTTAFLAVAALTASFAAPVYAEEEPSDPPLELPACPDFPGEPSAEDEFEAYRLALACGVNVEVVSLRDIDRQVFATPTGTLDAEIAVEPYRVRDTTGTWIPIDTTLVARPDGSAAAAATVIRVETGAGGNAPFVTATDPDGGSLSLRWPKGPLPAPSINGSVATFPNVLPDIDLAVQAEAVGFSWILIVKTPEAAANPELATIEVGIETVGLTVAEDPESGRIDVLDADGNVVFEAGQGIMWDSSSGGTEGASAFSATADEPAADPGRIGDVDVQHTGTGLTLVPDTGMLADPAVTYPLYIDPPFTSTRKAWANVLDSRSGTGWTGDSSWPRSGGMRVGLDTWSTCGSGCGLWRSAITLNIGGLKGKYIASASVNLLQTHMGGCGDQGLQLWRTGEISNGTSWNGVDWYYGDPLQSKTVPSSNKTGCSGKDNEWVEFDGANVKKRVQSAADNKNATISFGVRSSNEGTKDAWRRIQTSSVKLHVTYYVYPPTPDRLTVDGTGCDPTESGSPWVNERYPAFSARARSGEDEPVYLRFRVRKVASETNHYWYRTPDPVGPYSTVNRKTTTSLPDGSYKWQARSDSRQTEAVNSGYTGYCYFKVDATKPTVPSVIGPPGAVTVGSNVALTVSATDPTVNGVKSGVDRFEYSWTTPTYDQRVTSTGTATITRAAVAAGRHVLYVRAVDKAGNKSSEKVYTFFAGRDIPATSMGAWRLGGDLVDDTGHGNDLTVLSGGADFVTDTAKNKYLSNSEDCLTAPAPLRTDAAFTVATRVRLSQEGITGFPVIMSQGLAGARMFDLIISKRRAPELEEMISFRVWSSPSAGSKMYKAEAVNATIGEWVHIAADYDPDGGRIRLYLNGAIVAETPVSFTPWNARDAFTVGCRDWTDGTTTGFFTGGIENLGVWQGMLTSAQIAAKAQLPAGEIAHWELRGDGRDATSFNRELTLPESAKQGFDPFGRPDGALVLDGRSCAKTTAGVLPSDAAYAISAWVKPTTVGGGRFQAILSQADSAGNGVVLGIDETGNWAYGPAGAEGPSASSIQPMSVVPHPPKAGVWQHVALRYDGAGTVSLHVNGELEYNSVRTVTHVAAPFAVGCLNGASQFQGMLHDVRVWRGDPGRATMPGIGVVTPELASWWSLEGGTDDSGNGRNLAFTGYCEPADNRSNSPDKALKFTGAGSAATSTSVLNTDESFTVGAWVKFDSLATSQAIVSAAGTHNTGLRLAYNPERQGFEFTMTSQDAAAGNGAVYSIAHGGPTVVTGTWYFVAGSFDLRTKVMRLYVNGAEAGTKAGPASPWRANGPLLIGAAGTTSSRWSHLNGTVDDVIAFTGTVSPRAIANMYGTNEQEA
ncbi:LamG-like jellyroll fold domain-containing protein [Phytomonospora endophytica]|uniref:LamG-like jellyroll fold domain-containing protein n=1 Tax=Phytomonospora endophytica TaxID=714109 RepID=A0A841FBL7_9ACTN|nr:LamG-like jellyroll fold domain-containing protein [Phytomonospora endophytica]MBB6032403.1 hypothetical protein [Phytomonospora endophytica]GIG71383.1 hypothetical protein Pen01_76780 [Phytomonospora endophytica]